MAYFGPGHPSPKVISGWRSDLARFRTAYVAYVSQTADAIFDGAAVAYDERRQEVFRLAVVASRAMTAARVELAVAPPPVRGGAVLSGLPSVAFAHEDPRYRPLILPFDDDQPAKSSMELSIDAVDRADAVLSVREADARRRYRSPTFWIDRGLRLVLGFPGYLLSVVLGFEPTELSTSYQRLLWLISVAADFATLGAFVSIKFR